MSIKKTKTVRKNSTEAASAKTFGGGAAAANFDFLDTASIADEADAFKSIKTGSAGLLGGGDLFGDADNDDGEDDDNDLSFAKVSKTRGLHASVEDDDKIDDLVSAKILTTDANAIEQEAEIFSKRSNVKQLKTGGNVVETSTEELKERDSNDLDSIQATLDKLDMKKQKDLESSKSELEKMMTAVNTSTGNGNDDADLAMPEESVFNFADYIKNNDGDNDGGGLFD